MQDVHLCMYVCMYVCIYACVYKFHSLKAMQHFHLCMYGCMQACVYVYIYIYIYIYIYVCVSQGDFRLMSFTAGRCGTPLIVCVCHVHPDRKPIATNPDRRTSEASPPASDRKHFTNRTALVVQYCFNFRRQIIILTIF